MRRGETGERPVVPEIDAVPRLGSDAEESGREPRRIGEEDRDVVVSPHRRAEGATLGGDARDLQVVSAAGAEGATGLTSP